MLLADLEVGFHEQARLQPEIAAGLDAPWRGPHDLVRRLCEGLVPRPGWLAWLRRARELLDRRHPLDAPARAACRAAQAEVRQVLTEHLMTLAVPPVRRLRLGSDLEAAFPAPVARARHPELLELLARVDPSAGSVGGSGARDWADFAERMHFIADFFRCYLEDRPLFDAPFSAAQVRVLSRVGCLPPRCSARRP